MNEINFRKQKKLQTQSLHEFVKYFWDVLEPVAEFQDGWLLRTICQHLEAVTEGNIKRLLINVFPGSAKSLLTNVFWPAWMWGPKDLGHTRIVTFSYAAHLTERDNAKFRDLIKSPKYQELWGDRVQLTEDGKVKVANSKTGWKFASSVGGVGTGERGDIILCLAGETHLATKEDEKLGGLQIKDIVKRKLKVKVLGWDHEANKERWQTIEAYEANPVRRLLEIEFGDGWAIKCTDEHPIWIKGKGYVPARDVKIWDEGLSKYDGFVSVVSIKEAAEEPTYNVRVTPDHNYFANGILVHNCDDAHNIKEAESEAVRTETVRWVREAMSNRLNSMSEGKIVAIMQRSHSDDVSNLLMDLDYEHLMVPMEYDPSRHCQTSIGWEDPRTEEGELAWPERFPQEVVQDIRKTIGPYAYSSQYQQAPTIRGGAILKREYWQPYITEDGKVPPMSHIVASLDPAYTAKQQNDPSGFTVWGLWHDANGHSKFMCLNAWRKRLELHGPTIDRKVGETDAEYNQRTQKYWGLCEWVAYSCRRFRVDKLLIENKASGLSVAQEIRRLYRHEGWMVQTVDPGGDKIARANAVQALFADEQIYLPAYSDGAFRDWGEMLVAECEAFPKGSTDDLVDSTTQAMKYFRDNNMALRRNERNSYTEEQRKHVQHNVVPLYPV